MFTKSPFSASPSASDGELVGTNFERKYRTEGRPFFATTLNRVTLMHREGIDDENVQPEDILCDFCGDAAWAQWFTMRRRTPRQYRLRFMFNQGIYRPYAC